MRDAVLREQFTQTPTKTGGGSGGVVADGDRFMGSSLRDPYPVRGLSSGCWRLLVAWLTRRGGDDRGAATTPVPQPGSPRVLSGATAEFRAKTVTSYSHFIPGWHLVKHHKPELAGITRGDDAVRCDVDAAAPVFEQMDRAQQATLVEGRRTHREDRTKKRTVRSPMHTLPSIVVDTTWNAFKRTHFQ
jgi:hypothetical protein